MKGMKTIHVVAAVIRTGNEVFAVQRGYGEYKDMWEFPGGKIENDETPQEALVREIREEHNTLIRVGERIRLVEYDYRDFHLSMDCFWAEVQSGNLALLEAEDARWLDADHLETVNWLPADRLILETIAQELRKQDPPFRNAL